MKKQTNNPLFASLDVKVEGALSNRNIFADRQRRVRRRLFDSGIRQICRGRYKRNRLPLHAL